LKILNDFREKLHELRAKVVEFSEKLGFSLLAVMGTQEFDTSTHLLMFLLENPYSIGVPERGGIAVSPT